MKTCKTLALLSVVTLALGASVAVAQPVANAGNDRTVAATYHPGEFVQLKGGQSTGTITSFTWEATGFVGDPPQIAFFWLDGVNEGKNPIAFFPVGTTTVTLTVTDATDPLNPVTATDTVAIKITDKRYLSLVSYYRPWASDLPSRGAFILSDCNALEALEPGNQNFQTAQNAAEVAKAYEDFCQAMRFLYPSKAEYDSVVMEYYLLARQIQVEHHECVAFHVFYGKGKSWSAREKRTFENALDAAEIGDYDFGQGTIAAFPLQ